MERAMPTQRRGHFIDERQINSCSWMMDAPSTARSLKEINVGGAVLWIHLPAVI